MTTTIRRTNSPTEFTQIPSEQSPCLPSSPQREEQQQQQSWIPSIFSMLGQKQGRRGGDGGGKYHTPLSTDTTTDQDDEHDVVVGVDRNESSNPNYSSIANDNYNSNNKKKNMFLRRSKYGTLPSNAEETVASTVSDASSVLKNPKYQTKNSSIGDDNDGDVDEYHDEEEYDRNNDETERRESFSNFPVTWETYLYAICAALNSVNLGYDLGVSTNVGPLLKKDFQLTIPQLEMFLGSLNFWSIFGVMISPFVSDQFGRRMTLRVAAIGFMVGVALTALAPNFSICMLGRMIVGLGVGIGDAIDPMYIAEIAPPHVRGELVSWAEGALATGSTLGLTTSLLGVGWRTMVGLGAILPVVMVFLTTFVLPESPRWLIARQQEREARRILVKIYPTPEYVDQVVEDVQDSIALERAASDSVGWNALLKPSPAIRRMLVVGIGTAIIQQAVGIDSIMFYLMFILKNSGIQSDKGQDLALVGLGTVKLAFVFLGGRLFDHFGRRKLLFTSLLGMAASLVVVSFTFSNGQENTNDDDDDNAVNDEDSDEEDAAATSVWKMVTLIALAIYLAFFSIGLGPGTWVVTSEVFATSIRAKAMMMALVPNRITSTIMSSTFLTFAHLLSWPGFFLVLALICISSCIFLFCFLPETKGRSLEDMACLFAEITGDRSILDMEDHIRKQRMEEERQDKALPKTSKRTVAVTAESESGNQQSHGYTDDEEEPVSKGTFA